MSGPVIGEDGVARCPWGSAPGVMRDYHDREWGTRVHGEAAYLERLTLEAFQSGLSWSTILNKREAFREVFAASTPSGRGVRRGRRGAADAGRPDRAQPAQGRGRRHQRPARRSRCASDGGLEAFVLGFAPATAAGARDHRARSTTTSPESLALSKALKKHGFAFVGPTTMFALMEALGVFDPHLVGCHRARGRGTIGA